MNAYPTYPQQMDSRCIPISRMTARRATDGTFRGQLNSGSQKHTFTISHEISRSQASDLKAFHVANLGLPVTFVWNLDGDTYTVFIVDEPDISPVNGGNLVIAKVKLEEL